MNMLIFLAEGMLGDREYFRGGRLDRDALVGFIKEIKKNTKLSDEDAAVIAASKVGNEVFDNIVYKKSLPYIHMVYVRAPFMSNMSYMTYLTYMTYMTYMAYGI